MNQHISSKTKRMVLTALLFAMAMVLTILEGMLPPVPIPVPGVKLGLANIVVMYALFFIGNSAAFTLVFLKALFAMVSRGVVAGLLSFTGGMFSIVMMIILIYLLKDKITYFMLSIVGAVFHNLGQFVAISLIYVNMNLWFYLPYLLILGVVMGFVTSTLLQFILPTLKRLGLNKE